VTEGGVVPAGFGSDEATVAATFARPEKPVPVSTILPNLPKPSK